MALYVDNFIPTIWSAALLKTKEKSMVYAGLANRNYEGTIRQGGDRVKISQLGAINVNTYSTAALTIQALNSAALYLDVDQMKYFAFRVDDVDAVQSIVDFMGEATRKASYKLADTADQFLAGKYTQSAITRNTSSSPVDMTSTNVENEFLGISESLNLNNAPSIGRFAVIPYWVNTKLVLAGERILTDNKPIFTNGYVGTAWGIDFYVSNNVAKDSTAFADCKIICGIKGESLTYAEQIVNVEKYRMTDEGFGDVIKGQHIYGGRVLQADVTATLFADYTAES